MTPFTAQDIIDQTNAYREAQGLAPLMVNETLMEAAQKRAMEMAELGIFSHATSTTSGAPLAFPTYMKQSGYPYSYAGENLAEGYSTATGTMQGWVQSPTHNQNLVSPRYSEMGVAVVPGTYKGKKTNYVVHFFGSPQNPQVQSAAPITPTSTTPRAKTTQTPGKTTQKAVSKLPAKVPIPKSEPLFTPIPLNNANSTIPMTKQNLPIPMLSTQKG